MSNPSKANHTDDPFASFFAAAEKSPAYWAAQARLEFTEKVIERMTELGLTRSAFAARLQVQPGFVTRLLGGKNNIELATMTKIAKALECDFRCHLQPKGTETLWINVLKEEPERLPACENWRSSNYHPVSHGFNKSLSYEALPTAA